MISSVKRSTAQPTYAQRVAKDMRKHYMKYLLVLPVIIYFILFHYKPMYGIIIAFKDYRPGLGIFESNWVGFKHFVDFFTGPYFIRTLRNTFLISLYGLIFGFPAPILLALLLNELHSQKFKRVVQTISYLPHFVSVVVICGMIKSFTLSDGLVNNLIVAFGGTASSLLTKPEFFRPILIGTDIWAGLGWGSIIYLAALSGVDQALYEAAKIDGANKLQQTIHVTLPGIVPTIIIMFILRMGSMLSVGSEKILLLYSPAVYETGDVISTYVYRQGIEGAQYSFSTAVGIFNSIVNIIFLTGTNYISRRYSETSLF